MGRISFIFGASLFSVVAFRHVPELDRSANCLLIAKGGVILCASLFALFCVALELERLGQRSRTSVRSDEAAPPGGSPPGRAGVYAAHL